ELVQLRRRRAARERVADTADLAVSLADEVRRLGEGRTSAHDRPSLRPFAQERGHARDETLVASGLERVEEPSARSVALPPEHALDRVERRRCRAWVVLAPRFELEELDFEIADAAERLAEPLQLAPKGFRARGKRTSEEIEGGAEPARRNSHVVHG